jgi:Acetyltransferase (GNAT) domain
VPVVMLDATPAGEPLYERLGFVEQFRLTRLQRTTGPSSSESPHDVERHAGTVRPMSATDLDEVAALDRRAFGADRRGLLEWLRDGAPEYALVSRDATACTGFVLGRRGHDFDQIGPVVADRLAIAQQLVWSCVTGHPTRGFVLDAPDAHERWHAWMRGLGFTAQRPFVRMSRAADAHGTAAPPSFFCSAGPELG